MVIWNFAISCEMKFFRSLQHSAELKIKIKLIFSMFNQTCSNFSNVLGITKLAGWENVGQDMVSNELPPMMIMLSLVWNRNAWKNDQKLFLVENVMQRRQCKILGHSWEMLIMKVWCLLRKTDIYLLLWTCFPVHGILLLLIGDTII